jgi:hypothetical protein
VRLAFVVVALGLGATSAAAGDDDRAFVEATAPRDTYYVGEPVRVRLRFGVDTEFLRTSVVRLFQRPLDVPVQVEAPWAAGVPGAAPLADAAAPADGRGFTFALNDGTAGATLDGGEVRGGRAFTVGDVERSLVPDRPGDLVLAAPTLRYAYATQFEDGDLLGRVATDRRDAVVTGRATRIHVLALPAGGRPAGYEGAIGHFSVRADAAVREAFAGVPFKLTLRIEGEGNLAAFPAPRLDGLAGFHVLGAIDSPARGLRTITYDVAALRDDVRAVPSISFAYFDTTPPAQYRVAETPPIPLVVRADPNRPAAAEPAARDDGTMPVAAIAVAVAAAGAAIVFARRRAAARSRRPENPVRAAAERLRSTTATADVADAFAAFLGACLGVPAAAVIAPELAARLAAAGVPVDTAGRAAALLDGLVAARYGGAPAAPDARAAVLAAAAEIESAFDPERRGSRRR